MKEIGEQFEALIYRAIRQQAEGVITDLVDDVVQNAVDKYVTEFVKEEYNLDFITGSDKTGWHEVCAMAA